MCNKRCRARARMRLSLPQPLPHAQAAAGECDTDNTMTGPAGRCRKSCKDCKDCAHGDLVCYRSNLRSSRGGSIYKGTPGSS